MQYVTAVIWGREGIFPLNLDLKAKSGLSKDTHADGCHKEINYSPPPFQHCGIRFMVLPLPPRKVSGEGEEGLDHGSEKQQEDTGERIMDEAVGDYAASLNLRNMMAYSIDDSTYFMKAITTKMKNVGRVQVAVSIGENAEKFFVTNRIDWKPKR
jgi:hypothetical protein